MSTNDDHRDADSAVKKDDYLIQYVVVRNDLKDWPIGAIVAQCCHASTAAIHLNYADELTQLYLADLNRMHKCVLEVSNLDELLQLDIKLKDNSIKSKLWVEQPEDFPTCLATKPYYKKQVEKYFKKFKLLKKFAI